MNFQEYLTENDNFYKQLTTEEFRNKLLTILKDKANKEFNYKFELDFGADDKYAEFRPNNGKGAAIIRVDFPQKLVTLYNGMNIAKQDKYSNSTDLKNIIQKFFDIHFNEE